MIYTIEGFSTQVLMEYGLDCNDAVILRYVSLFYHSDKMKIITINGIQYFWVAYQNVIDQIPILGIKSKRAIANRFKKYVDCGLMESYIDQSQGNQTYFRFIPASYTKLISKSYQTNQNTNNKTDNESGKTNENESTPIELNNNLCNPNDKSMESELHTLCNPNDNNYNTIDNNTSIQSLSKDKEELSGELILSDQMDYSPQMMKTLSKKDLDEILAVLIVRFNKITGKSYSVTDSLKKYYYSRIKQVGLKRLYNAMMNYAHSEWHQEKDTWYLSKLFSDPEMVANWENKYPDKKPLSKTMNEMKQSTIRVLDFFDSKGID